MHKSISRIAILAAATALTAQPAQAAQCSADASFVRQWEGGRMGDADWTVKFRVSPSCSDSYCSGMVKFKLHYRAPSGRSFYETGMASWSSGNNRSVEATDEVESSLCDESDDRCTFVDVQVTDVTCYD